MPIHPASTFRQRDPDVRQDFDYSRSGNPTRQALEDLLRVLEQGARGYAFASGVAAITAALTAVLRQGDHVVLTENVYGGTYRLMTGYLSRFGIEHTFVDSCDLTALEAAITPRTRLIWIETPSNPLLKITDLDAVVDIARRHGVLTAVDNTFMTPYFLRPLERGCDLSVHSATKFLGGHSDLMAGAVVTRTEELGKEIYFVQNATGSMLSPEGSWLLIRGIKTLGARLKAEAAGALTIARWLQQQPFVSRVYYPGLPDHPGHEILLRQASGFGAVLSFETDTPGRAKQIMTRTRIWALAVSLGGVESILSCPARMSHAAIPRPIRERIGIRDHLLRLSVGLEDPQDLIDDLDQAAR